MHWSRPVWPMNWEPTFLSFMNNRQRVRSASWVGWKTECAEKTETAASGFSSFALYLSCSQPYPYICISCSMKRFRTGHTHNTPNIHHIQHTQHTTYTHRLLYTYPTTHTTTTITITSYAHTHIHSPHIHTIHMSKDIYHPTHIDLIFTHTYHTHIQYLHYIHNICTSSITHISHTTDTTITLLSQPVHTHTTHHTQTFIHTHSSHISHTPRHTHTYTPHAPQHTPTSDTSTQHTLPHVHHPPTHTHFQVPSVCSECFSVSFIDGHHMCLCVTVISIFLPTFSYLVQVLSLINFCFPQKNHYHMYSGLSEYWINQTEYNKIIFNLTGGGYRINKCIAGGLHRPLGKENWTFS